VGQPLGNVKTAEVRKYETSTDSDRKSFVQATEKRAQKSSFSPFLNQEKVDSRAL
jgi:hypothetical protein